jgi:hypothetical protein
MSCRQKEKFCSTLSPTLNAARKLGQNGTASWGLWKLCTCEQGIQKTKTWSALSWQWTQRVFSSINPHAASRHQGLDRELWGPLFCLEGGKQNPRSSEIVHKSSFPHYLSPKQEPVAALGFHKSQNFEKRSLPFQLVELWSKEHGVNPCCSFFPYVLSSFGPRLGTIIEAHGRKGKGSPASRWKLNAPRSLLRAGSLESSPTQVFAILV